METRMSNGLTAEQRRRIRWTTVVLSLTALGIYVAFIASSVMKAQH
jgi:hypothetical protein